MTWLLWFRFIVPAILLALAVTLAWAAATNRE